MLRCGGPGPTYNRPQGYSGSVSVFSTITGAGGGGGGSGTTQIHQVQEMKMVPWWIRWRRRT